MGFGFQAYLPRGLMTSCVGTSKSWELTLVVHVSAYSSSMHPWCQRVGSLRQTWWILRTVWEEGTCGGRISPAPSREPTGTVPPGKRLHHALMSQPSGTTVGQTGFTTLQSYECQRFGKKDTIFCKSFFHGLLLSGKGKSDHFAFQKMLSIKYRNLNTFFLTFMFWIIFQNHVLPF